jgi:hypothetical protein
VVEKICGPGIAFHPLWLLPEIVRWAISYRSALSLSAKALNDKILNPEKT